jgi:pimeloyl-ACP methyl ester carboxylesterase
MRRAATIVALILFVAAGCTEKHPPADKRIVFLLPGVAGGKYETLTRAIEESAKCEVRRVPWGAPAPLFMLNFSNRKIHEDAERKLAEAILEYRATHPSAEVDLIGHSAGCGVILGALKRLPAHAHIRTVALLAPSVSPKYDLTPAILKLERLHVFTSSLDTVFLKWRTSHFGTYDNIKTPAAGNAGFDLSSLSSELRAKVIEHPYSDAWKSLGNDGGHFGTLADDFAKKIIAPPFASPCPADASRLR